MPLTGETSSCLSQLESTADGEECGRWIACDESGWDGEQLVGRKRRFLVFASAAVDDAEAAPLVQELRGQARIRQAGELKFRLFKDHTQRWSLLQQVWGPGGALHDWCSVYVVDKEYAAVAKVIDLLLEEKEHAEGGNLYADGQTRDLARTLALEGRRALRGPLFEELVSAFVALASQRGVGRQTDASEALFAVIDRALGGLVAQGRHRAAGPGAEGVNRVMPARQPGAARTAGTILSSVRQPCRLGGELDGDGHLSFR
ncbi:hypothetical protein [Streptomyces griseus]|uniref:hypothetical protein n=1 Tax=Streptomyces griseus TaxID=1911 RepID=UPI00131CE621|nr:hypothetical protein [Streptomyces griseus]